MCSAHQSRKVDRSPCGTQTSPFASLNSKPRMTFNIVISEICRPLLDAKTMSVPFTLGWTSTKQARAGHRTQHRLSRAAGIVQGLASRANSDHTAPRASDRAGLTTAYGHYSVPLDCGRSRASGLKFLAAHACLFPPAPLRMQELHIHRGAADHRGETCLRRGGRPVAQPQQASSAHRRRALKRDDFQASVSRHRMA